MKSKVFRLAVPMIAVLAVGSSALAQRLAHKEFNGVINGYSPQTTTTTGTPAVTTTTGPYEIRGPWSLKVKDSGKAEFYAALNMELSDGWVMSENMGNFDPTKRDPHTHHISLVDRDVTRLANGGFQVTGTATVTLSGNPAPISPTPLVITITGGNDVEFSNITLTFGMPGSKHFGAVPITGVVRSVRDER
jgi:hypothetical protein